MKPRRLVLDTNVLVSALLFRRGRLDWLRMAWQAGMVTPLISREAASELLRVLAYPTFRLDAAEREELLADLLPWCETVIVSEPPLATECRDPDDRPFLELAIVARCDGLITGDVDLLDLAPVFPVPILTPRALRDRLGADSPPSDRQT